MSSLKPGELRAMVQSPSPAATAEQVRQMLDAELEMLGQAEKLLGLLRAPNLLPAQREAVEVLGRLVAGLVEIKRAWRDRLDHQGETNAR